MHVAVPQVRKHLWVTRDRDAVEGSSTSALCLAIDNTRGMAYVGATDGSVRAYGLEVR